MAIKQIEVAGELHDIHVNLDNVEGFKIFDIELNYDDNTWYFVDNESNPIDELNNMEMPDFDSLFSNYEMAFLRVNHSDLLSRVIIDSEYNAFAGLCSDSELIIVSWAYDCPRIWETKSLDGLTETQVNNLITNAELISVDDIDNICGTVIQVANERVTF